MRIGIDPLRNRQQTGAAIWNSAQFYADLGDKLDLTLSDFFTYVKNIPYTEDPEEFEIVARPKYLLDKNRFSKLDCKKKSVLMLAWAIAHNIPARLIAIDEKGSGIHHVFPQFKIEGKWQNVDATYPNYQLFQKKKAYEAEELLQPKLMTLNGMGNRMGQNKFSLISLTGNNGQGDALLKVDPRELSDRDAGVWALYSIVKFNPGITWGDLLRKNVNLSGWNPFKNLGRKIQNVGNDFSSWVGNTVSDAGDKLGEWSGDTIRLLTDKEVVDGLSQYGAAYATGGASMAVDGFSLDGFLSSLGASTKKRVNTASIGGFENVDPKILAMVAGGVILLVIALK